MRLIYLLLFLLVGFDCLGAAGFGGEVQRWNVTNSTATTTITLTSGVAQNSEAVAMFGWELTGLTISSVADSRGNSWSVITNQTYNTVHSSAMAAAYLTTALQVGDTLTLTFSATASSHVVAGTLVYLTGCANAAPDVVFAKNTFGNTVAVTGSTTVHNDIAIGCVQVDQVTSTYTIGSWNKIGATQLFGNVPGSTDGLANTYAWLLTGNAGSYTFDGTLNINDSWGAFWAAFKASTGQTSTNFYVDYSSGSDANNGTSTASPFKHCPGDLLATSTAASTVLTNSNVHFKGGVTYPEQIEITNGWHDAIYDGNSAGSWGTGVAKFDLGGTNYHAFNAHDSTVTNITVNAFDITGYQNITGDTETNVIGGWGGGGGSTNVVTYLGNGSLFGLGALYIQNCSGWTVNGLTIHNAQNWQDYSIPNGQTGNEVPCQQICVNIQGGNTAPCLITNLTCWAIGREAIRILGGSNIKIQGCNIGGASSLGTNQGWFAVAFKIAFGGGGLSTTNILISNNQIHDGWQYGGDYPLQASHAGDWIHIYGNNNTVFEPLVDPNNIVIASNTFWNNWAFQYANGTGNTYCEQEVFNTWFINNLMVNPQHMGIWNQFTSNMYVLNNTLVCYNSSQGGGVNPLFLASNGTNQYVTNNIIVALSSNSAVMPLTMGSGGNIPVSDYNLFYNPATVSFGSIRYTNVNRSLSSWQSTFGMDQHSAYGNPLFISMPADGSTSSSGNFALANGSPAVGTGASLSGIFTTDINGASRSFWDVGAFAFGNIGVPRFVIGNGVQAGLIYQQ